MNYLPLVKSVRRVSGGRLGDKHTVLLFDDVVPGGGVQYKYIVGVFSNEDLQPVYFVASETNSMAKAFGGGSHFLGLFEGNGHSNCGADDKWADAGLFFPAALAIVGQQFDPGRGEAPIEVTEYEQESSGERFDRDKMQAAFMEAQKRPRGGPGGPKPPCGCGCIAVLVILAIVVTGVVVLVRMFK